MLTRIVHNSAKLCTLVDQLDLNLSKPQRQHLLNLADALLVCEDEQTLAALQRQFLKAPAASNIIEWLTGALQMMQETGDLQQVLLRFLRLESLPA